MRFQNECDKVAMINQDEIKHRIKKLTYHFSVNFTFLHCMYLFLCDRNDASFFYLYAGRVLKSEAFDTHGDGSAGTRLRDFLNAQGAE